MPEYMVPNAFAFLEQMPLTLNGKIDRKKLPMPGHERSGLENGYVAPATPIQRWLSALWGELLGLERVGIRDNFFELGGDSLMASRVLSRLACEYQTELRLRSFFAAPTVEAFAREMEGGNEQRTLSGRRLERVSREQFLPVSYAQRRIWLFAQLHPGDVCYNVAEAVRIRGPLEEGKLRRALVGLVRRHEILRTRFVPQQGEPRQQIDPAGEVWLRVIDLRGVEAGQRERQARELLEQEAKSSFDLEQGPLFRTLLLQVKAREYLFLVNAHHIVTDGWSQGVLWRDLEALYAADGEEPRGLPELGIQYADYAVWHREWLDEEQMQEQWSYWKRQLKGVAAILDLPLDRVRPAVQTFRGEQERFELSARLTQSLKELSRAQGVTLFMTLLATFKTLLYRYSAQEDIVVGTPIAGRQRREVEDLIGFFINTLVLRTDVSGNPSFNKLLERVQKMAVEAYSHQDFPFEKLVEELHPERDASSNPIFQVMFVLQNTPEMARKLPGLEIQVESIETGTAMFDLTLSLTEVGEGIQGWLEYNVDLFEQSTIARLAATYQRMLERVVADPGTDIGNLLLLTSTERQQVVEEWNQTCSAYPREKCVQELFQEQVKRTPDALAIMYEGKRLSYAELNQRANQLAWYLKSLGVGPEVRVGICVERSLEMFVGLMGVIKAGGAYVPLDPGYPADRLKFMTHDASLAVLLIHEQSAKTAPHGVFRRVDLNREWTYISHLPDHDVPTSNHSENLVYVIYTSGSMGRPKGVAVTHRSLCNQNSWAKRAFRMSDSDRFLQKNSFSFDASVGEIFTTLTVGAQIVAARAGGERETDYLIELVEKEGVTCVDLPPSLLQSVLENLKPGQWKSVRLALSGGEVLRPQLVRLFHTRLSATLVNLYGPTETTVESTIAQTEKEKETVPIGQPIANTQVYVLDGRSEPVPIGVAGELYIGGEGLARGYLGQPGPTAEKFVPDPFNHAPGQRLYRTGDRVCWDANGDLHFLGRADHQVKLRGYRIELGEIERTLERHNQVEQALVDFRSGRLVGYVVKKFGAQQLTPGELRSYLKKQLPEYMVPIVWVELERFPLSPNGKVDRKRLPAPQVDGRETEYVPPGNAIEETLCALWQEVLKQNKIGIHDNFFELGGHSLLATQLVSRFPGAFAIELPVRVLFEGPTVAELAIKINQCRARASSTDDISDAFVHKKLTTEQMLATLESLSEDEIELLLNMHEPH